MQKQILYPKFIERFLVDLIDLMIINTLCSYICWAVKTLIDYLYKEWNSYPVFFQKLIINPVNLPLEKFADKGQISLFTLWSMMPKPSVLLNIGMGLMIYGIYFILFWRYLATTPAKYLARMRVVDAATHRNLSFKQCFIRFIYSVIMPFGLFLTLINKQRRSPYDKAANSIVISA